MTSNPPQTPWLAASAIAVGLSIPQLLAWSDGPAKQVFPVPADEPSIVHLLNRTTFGVRPTDVDRVKTLGMAAWLDEQLHPERLPDATVTARVARFTTLTMSTSQLAQEYFLPARIERNRLQQAQAGSGTPAARPPAAGTPGQTTPPPDRTPPEMRPGQRPNGGPVREVMSEAMLKERRVLSELMEQKILRAVYSDRQLQEVLVDFWFNHFNVFVGKGPTRAYLTEYERDAIRPHVLGKFRDLLGATAKSPAMLFYLDNWMSSDPNATNDGYGVQRRAARQPRRPLMGVGERRPVNPGAPNNPNLQNPNVARPRGLNENYARELMELHTLGVEGGYTQQDVKEVARAFTGWTIDRPQQGGGFRFEPRFHDNGKKVVLRQVMVAGGQKDGEAVLDLLAKHPSTARFIATKLARRFVSDDPPKAVVDRAAARFTETDGDIREVVRTILTSREFLSVEARRAKVKTPLEFVVSALRATDAQIADARLAIGALRDLGMPLYGCQPPTGYSDKAEAWVNTGALLNRMNFALTLVGSRNRAIQVDLARLAPGGAEVARGALPARLLNGPISEATRTQIDKAATPEQIAALVIGAPEFQRR